jgi:hypothetical protein
MRALFPPQVRIGIGPRLTLLIPILSQIYLQGVSQDPSLSLDGAGLEYAFGRR